MKVAKKTSGLAIATAALLIAGCASDDKMTKTDKSMMGDDSIGQCHGVNSCKAKVLVRLPKVLVKAKIVAKERAG